MAWQVEINPDYTSVQLDLSQLNSGDEISDDLIIGQLTEKKIPIDAKLEKRIHELVAKIESQNHEKGKFVLLQARAPAHGKDGYYEWSESCDPEKRKEKKDSQNSKDPSTFYNQSGIIIVGQGDVIGTIHPPTEDVPGEDVLGREIPSHPGIEANIEPGNNVELSADQKTFVAQCNGEPKLEGTTLSVDSTINIEGDVDFSTGNITYSGDLVIGGDVKDLFEVTAGGDITVKGTIEAAKIECGGSLEALQGISGKEKGLITIQQDLSAKYLSNVEAWVKGDVTVDSEIVNTDLNSGGTITLQKGAFHGGRITTAGNVEAPIVGTPTGTRTIIRVGINPFLERQIKELQETEKSLETETASLVSNAKLHLSYSRGIPSDEVKEMAAKIKINQQAMSELSEKLVSLKKELPTGKDSKIIIQKQLYSGTLVYIGDVSRSIDDDLIGPIEIFTEADQDSDLTTLCIQGPHFSTKSV